MTPAVVTTVRTPAIPGRPETRRVERVQARGPLNMGQPLDGSYAALHGHWWRLDWRRTFEGLTLSRDTGAGWVDVQPGQAFPTLPPTARHIGLAFDQSARHIFCWENGGQFMVRQWDATAGGIGPSGAVTTRANRAVVNGASSIVTASYVNIVSDVGRFVTGVSIKSQPSGGSRQAAVWDQSTGALLATGPASAIQDGVLPLAAPVWLEAWRVYRIGVRSADANATVSVAGSSVASWPGLDDFTHVTVGSVALQQRDDPISSSGSNVFDPYPRLIAFRLDMTRTVTLYSLIDPYADGISRRAIVFDANMVEITRSGVVSGAQADFPTPPVLQSGAAYHVGWYSESAGRFKRQQFSNSYECTVGNNGAAFYLQDGQPFGTYTYTSGFWPTFSMIVSSTRNPDVYTVAADDPANRAVYPDTPITPGGAYPQFDVLTQEGALQGAYLYLGPFAGVDPLVWNDTTAKYYSPDSDILLIYLTPDRTEARYRLQRDAYATEYVLASGLTGAVLDQVVSLPYGAQVRGENAGVDWTLDFGLYPLRPSEAVAATTVFHDALYEQVLFAGGSADAASGSAYVIGGTLEANVTSMSSADVASGSANVMGGTYELTTQSASSADSASGAANVQGGSYDNIGTHLAHADATTGSASISGGSYDPA